MKKQVQTAQDFGKIVRQTRKLQALSQEELAGLTGTGRRFISELENGKGSVQLDKALHVLGMLGVSLLATCQWD